MTCLPQRQEETKPKRRAVQYHRRITLCLHSVFNDLFFRVSALLWKLTWSGSKLLVGCAFIATMDPFGSFHVMSIVYSVGQFCPNAIII